MYKNEYFDLRVSMVEVRWFLDINGFDNLTKFVDFIGSRHPNVRKRIHFVHSLRSQR